jgi:hypothetical protein
MVGCRAAFSAVLDDLDFHLQHVPAGAVRDHLAALRAPLVALQSRYDDAAERHRGPAPDAPADPAPSAPEG